ncbi:MAG: hypothetical protein P8011_00135 [Acidihalobacter sp.]|uniref:hypothetical protein n=1 Tax=Acidihalobacter sp. TaxID=1872108 RepID=UPI00307E9CFB
MKRTHLIASLMLAFAGAAAQAHAATLTTSASRETAHGVAINGVSMGLHIDRLTMGFAERTGHDTLSPGNYRTSTRVTSTYQLPTLRRGSWALASSIAASLQQISLPTQGGYAPGNTSTTYGRLGGSLAASRALVSGQVVTLGVGIQPWAERLPSGGGQLSAPTDTSLALYTPIQGGGLTIEGVHSAGNVPGMRLSGESLAVRYQGHGGLEAGVSYTHGFAVGATEAQLADVSFPSPDPRHPWTSYADGLAAYASLPVPVVHGLRADAGFVTNIPPGSSRVTTVKAGISYSF